MAHLFVTYSCVCVCVSRYKNKLTQDENNSEMISFCKGKVVLISASECVCF